jgi:hypothetical protein
MTERDIQIIAMVYEYEGCGVEHVRQLFFHGASNRSIPCYRRLSYLVKQGYLRSILLPALHKHFLIPGARARSVLSHVLKGLEMKRIRIESPLLILHKLALCDIRLALEVAGKASAVFLITQWVNESALRQAPLSVEDPASNKQTRLIPDASFTLHSRRTGKSATFYLELDRATVSLKSIRERVRGYLLRGQNPSPVLFVVPDTMRHTAIATVALEEAARLKANPTSIWITQKGTITPETIISAPWGVVGHETPVTFQSLAAPIGEERTVVLTGSGGHLE